MSQLYTIREESTSPDGRMSGPWLASSRINGVTLDQNDALIHFNSVTGKNCEILRE